MMDLSIFDKTVKREHTNSLKYDFKTERNKPVDVLPMWVADMDFECPKEIQEAIAKRAKHGVFGYTKHDKDYFDAIAYWWKKFFNVNLKEEWLITTPGVVFALATAVKTLTNEGDYVLICNPVYYPFTEVVEDNKRKIISSDLINVNGKYQIDFADFESKITKYNIKLFLLCSPHNPVGRVWTKGELDKIVEICKKHNVFIVSDEIHCDFVWRNKHICLLKYKNYIDKMIVCTAPSKTFNLAGLQTSNIFIPNKEIRDKFQNELWNTGYSLINTFGLVACKTAYRSCENWLSQLKSYLQENIKLVEQFLKKNMPKVKMTSTEGTYLLWLDFNAYNLNDNEIENIMLNKAKLWVDNGTMFGKSGKGFQRLNIALPRAKLQIALKQMQKAFENI